MIMGSGNNPVDSIYGFAFSYFINEYNIDVDSSSFYLSMLGIPTVDLWANQSYGYAGRTQYHRNHTVMCRTDFQNVVNVSDTVGLLRFRWWSLTQQLSTPTIADFKAVLVSGTEIQFSVCAESVFIDSSSVSVKENSNIRLTIFPNPVNGMLNLKTENNSMKKIVLLNALGENIKEITSSEMNLKLDVADLPNGFYFGTVFSEAAVGNFRFVVEQ
jgi:hypothetical protein